MSQSQNKVNLEDVMWRILQDKKPRHEHEIHRLCCEIYRQAVLACGGGPGFESPQGYAPYDPLSLRYIAEAMKKNLSKEEEED